MSKNPYGPQLAISREIHATKYRTPGESFEQAMSRIAAVLGDSPRYENILEGILLEQRFVPAGRIQAAIGSTRQVTPFNCYVAPKIEDSFVHGDYSIMDVAKYAAATMRAGGGIGYDFSTLRPKGDTIRKLLSTSSGPISFMEIYDAVCACVASAGHRQGAQMGVLRVDHPDIEQFVHAKQPDVVSAPLWDLVASGNRSDLFHALQATLKLTRFNISVAITDAFMEAVDADAAFQLQFGGVPYREVEAKALWNAIMESTWDWAEPGVLFIDTINRMNNLNYCEVIAATNPCGEQPLPPNGACLLGSFNLVKYLIEHRDYYQFDYDGLRADIPHVVRAMDNVIEHAHYPLLEQKLEAFNKRRMGLGVLGLANAIEAMGYPYGERDFVEVQTRIMEIIRDECYNASADLAAEKGSFPLFDKDIYPTTPFIQTLPEDVRHRIRKKGMRNSHLTSIAPTGTISLTCDNVSSGIEPVFAYSFDRTINGPTGRVVERVEDYGVRVLGIEGKRTKDVTLQEHIDVLVTAAKLVDSAVSKTCNVPSNINREDFQAVYRQAWERGAKGCTTFRVGGKRMGILNDTDDDGKQCRIDAETGRKECE